MAEHEGDVDHRRARRGLDDAEGEIALRVSAGRGAARGADALGAIGGEAPEEVLAEHQLGVEIGLEERIPPGAAGILLVLVGVDDDGLRHGEDALGEEIERRLGEPVAGRKRDEPRAGRRGDAGGEGLAGRRSDGHDPRRRRQVAAGDHQLERAVELVAHAPHRALDGARVGAGLDRDHHGEARTPGEGGDVAPDQAPVEAGQHVVRRDPARVVGRIIGAQERLQPAGLLPLQLEANGALEAAEAAAGAPDGLPYRPGEATQPPRGALVRRNAFRRAGQGPVRHASFPSPALVAGRTHRSQSLVCRGAERVRRRDRRRGARRCRERGRRRRRTPPRPCRE